MTLRAITREIIRQVETETGIPVRVMEDSQLQVLATVRMARAGGLPPHLILYKQSPGEPPDYQICFQCTYILRRFANPLERQFDLIYTTDGGSPIDNMTSASARVAAKFRLIKELIDQISLQFRIGLRVRIRSLHVGSNMPH